MERSIGCSVAGKLPHDAHNNGLLASGPPFCMQTINVSRQSESVAMVLTSVGPPQLLAPWLATLC